MSTGVSNVLKQNASEVERTPAWGEAAESGGAEFVGKADEDRQPRSAPAPAEMDPHSRRQVEHAC